MGKTMVQRHCFHQGGNELSEYTPLPPLIPQPFLRHICLCSLWTRGSKRAEKKSRRKKKTQSLPVWMRVCRMRWAVWWNTFPQCPQLNVPSPSWMRLCARNWLAYLNCLPQLRHWYFWWPSGPVSSNASSCSCSPLPAPPSPSSPGGRSEVSATSTSDAASSGPCSPSSKAYTSTSVR